MQAAKDCQNVWYPSRKEQAYNWRAFLVRYCLLAQRLAQPLAQTLPLQEAGRSQHIVATQHGDSAYFEPAADIHAREPT